MLGKMLKCLLGRKSDDRMTWLLIKLIRRYGSALSSREYLRFLLVLDERIYALEGPAAVAFENGIHPKHRLMRYHDFFTARIARHERVLDVGCGHGALAFSIADKTGAEVTGIDILETNVLKAQQRHAHPNVKYAIGDATKGLPDGEYDIVVLSNVLEHLEQRPEFIQRVQAAAKPEKWLIRVPVFERDWRVPMKKELGVEWRLDETHFIEYTVETFKEEMRTAGLAIQHLEVRWGEIWSELKPKG